MQELVTLLLVQNIISVSDIIDTGVQVIEEERDRFVVRTVSVGRKPLYIVKCARSEKAEVALKQEVSAYHCLTMSMQLQDIAPVLVMHDNVQALMVIEWVNGVNPIATNVSLREVAEKLGKVIGKLHQNTLQIPDKRSSFFKPYMLTDLNHSKKWEKFPELNINITERWKKTLIDGIKYAEHLWISNVFIHGDLKWEHCLFIDDKNSASLRVIDWELATFGDSAWDVACIISDMIFNIQCKINDGEQSLFEALQSEEIKIFLQSYAKERVIEDYLLEHVSSYLGVRLFQTALELVSVYGWENKESKADILLSMAVNIFNDFESVLDILKNRLSE